MVEEVKNPGSTHTFLKRDVSAQSKEEVKLKTTFSSFYFSLHTKRLKNVQVGGFDFSCPAYARFFAFCMQIAYKLQRPYLNHTLTKFHKFFLKKLLLSGEQNSKVSSKSVQN